MVSTRAFGVFSGTTADGDVTEGTTVSPVPATSFAEMTWLRVVVVVVVTKLSVC